MQLKHKTQEKQRPLKLKKVSTAKMYTMTQLL